MPRSGQTLVRVIRTLLIVVDDGMNEINCLLKIKKFDTFSICIYSILNIKLFIFNVNLSFFNQLFFNCFLHGIFECNEKI